MVFQRQASLLLLATCLADFKLSLYMDSPEMVSEMLSKHIAEVPEKQRGAIFHSRLTKGIDTIHLI